MRTAAIVVLLAATVACAPPNPPSTEPPSSPSESAVPLVVVMRTNDRPVYVPLDGTGRLPAGEIVAVSTNPTASVDAPGVESDNPLPPPRLHGDQWGLRSVGASAAWEVSRGEGIRVAVLDTGVDTEHPELTHAIVSGLDVVDKGTVHDPNGHGTHVAGIIAAADDTVGVTGLAPGVHIMPVRVLDVEGRGDHITIAEGIIWSVDNGAHIINLSLGGPGSDILQSAVEYAIRNDVIVVAAAGNSGGLLGNTVSYPAAYSGVLAVAATGPDDTAALFSSSGPHVSLAAPGFAVYSTVPSGEYGYASGTSQAAPFVAAAAALLLSTGVSSQETVRILTQTARDVAPQGRDNATGAGTLDAGNALAGVRTPAEIGGPPRTPLVVPPAISPGAGMGSLLAPPTVRAGESFVLAVAMLGCPSCLWELRTSTGSSTILSSESGWVEHPMVLRESATIELLSDEEIVATVFVEVTREIVITRSMHHAGVTTIEGTSPVAGMLRLEYLRNNTWDVVSSMETTGDFVFRLTTSQRGFYRLTGPSGTESVPVRV